VLQVVFFEDTDINYLVQKYWAKQYFLVEGILRKGVETGIFRPINTHLLAIMVRGMILGYFMSSPITDRLPGMEDHQSEYDEQLDDSTLDLLLNGLLVVKQ